MLKKILVFAVIILILVFGYFWLIRSEPVKMYQVGDLMLVVSLNPNPPRVGDVKLKINLMDAKHQPIDDAQIDISYGMPAMGNMPAMHSESGAGFGGRHYEALLSVSMLGSWDLGIKVTRSNGKVNQGNFKFSTGQKGLSFYPDEEKPATMDMSSMGSMVKLTGQQVKLAEVGSVPLRELLISRRIRAAGAVAYDPELQVAEQEYLSGLNDPSLLPLAKAKLELMGISEEEFHLLQTSQKVDSALLLPEERAWIYANIYEYEIQGIKAGQKVESTSVSYPETKFHGIVRAIVPVLDSKTRSNKIRIEVSNAGNKLSPNMYVDVSFDIPLGYKLALPKDAVLQTGRQQIVYVDKGAGYYEKRTVVLGPLAYANSQAVYPVVSGVKAGEPVVVAANFLIDSQSELSGGISGLYGSAAKEVKKEHKH